MLPVVQQRLRRHQSSRVCIALGLICLIALFAGCGTYTPGQGGQAHSTPTSIPASPQQAQNCGTVNTVLNGQPVDRNQARLAGNCFWQAFQRCQAATLLLKEHSLDTGASGKRFNVARPRHFFSRNIALTPEQTIHLLLKATTANARS